MCCVCLYVLCVVCCMCCLCCLCCVCCVYSIFSFHHCISHTWYRSKFDILQCVDDLSTHGIVGERAAQIFRRYKFFQISPSAKTHTKPTAAAPSAPADAPATADVPV